jgi:hypothetical protein
MLLLVVEYVAELRKRVSDIMYTKSLGRHLEAGETLMPVRMPPERCNLPDISDKRWTSILTNFLSCVQS